MSTFDDFWEIYPRKVAKGAARKAWNAAIKKAKPDDIVASVSQYTASLAAQRASRGWAPEVCYPATFLNSERWLDYHDDAESDIVKVPVDKDEVRLRVVADCIKRGIYSASTPDHIARLAVARGYVEAERAREVGYLV